MNREHFPHWPAGLPYTLTTPQTTLVANLDISALRYPEKIALVFFGKKITYRALKAEVDLLAAYLQQCGIKRSDRVILQPAIRDGVLCHLAGRRHRCTGQPNVVNG